MFEVGEVVFCPMRGSGVVEAIETRTMLNESKEYVIIQMKEPSLVMMIPTNKVDQSGFRKINDETAVDKMENVLCEEAVEISYAVDNKIRTKKNQEKLSSGSFLKCSEVVRDLSCMENVKSLNNVEKTMLMQAKKLLLDEFSIIKNISIKEAGNILESYLEERAANE